MCLYGWQDQCGAVGKASICKPSLFSDSPTLAHGTPSATLNAHTLALPFNCGMLVSFLDLTGFWRERERKINCCSTLSVFAKDQSPLTAPAAAHLWWRRWNWRYFECLLLKRARPPILHSSSHRGVAVLCTYERLIPSPPLPVDKHGRRRRRM